jgi:hypothetical protein
MKRCVGLAAVFAGVLAVAANVAGQEMGPVPETRGPRIALSQDSWDFGEVWHPESVWLTLEVRNQGDQTLRLDRVRSTCGCTVVQPRATSIPPDENTEIPIRFDTRHKQNEVHSKVLIDCNDPQRPHIEFNIKGFVKRAITRTPLGGAVIRTLDTAPGQTGSVHLVNQTNEPLQLKLLSVDIPGLDVEIKPITPELEYDVIIRTEKEWQRGITRGKAVFSTGLTREPQFEVALQVRILSLVEASPPAIYLDPTDDKYQQPTERMIAVRYYGSERLRITGYKCANDQVKANIGPAYPPRGGMAQLTPRITAQARISLTIPALDKISPGGDVVEFTTNDEKFPRFQVLITTDRAAWEKEIYGGSASALHD